MPSPKAKEPKPIEPNSPEWYLVTIRREVVDQPSITPRHEAMLREASYYEMGLKREIPAEWSLQFAHLADPEWAEYLRLKEKFENG